MRAYVTLELFNQKGKRVSKRRFRSRSFVEAFLSILKAQIDPGTDVASITDTTNNDRTIKENTANLSCDPSGNTTGLVVGTGTTAVDVTDYKLATIIADGAAADKLVHGATVVSAMTISDPNASFTVQRDFTNSSGAEITVYEVGLYGRGRDTGDVTRYFMFLRDLITGGQAVPDGQTLRVTYTFQTST